MIEKRLSTEKVYQGKVIEVERDRVEIATGRESVREVVRHTGGVVIVAIKEAARILMVKQFRYPINSDALELPAGKLERGEDPDIASRRELEEETGYSAEKWTSMGFIYTSPGFSDEKLYLYKAENLTFVGEHPDEGEILEPMEYNIEDIFKMIKNGELNDSKTICAMARAFKL